MKFDLRLATGEGVFLVLSSGVTANQCGWERTSKDLFVGQNEPKISEAVEVLVRCWLIVVVPATFLTDLRCAVDLVSYLGCACLLAMLNGQVHFG